MSKLNDWLQTLTSIGVILGLVIVAYEIRQNTIIAKLEHYRENHRNWMHVSSLELETNVLQTVIKSIEDPENLSAEDEGKLDAWLILNMSIFSYGERADEFGIATTAALMREEDARYYFASEYSRRWFERAGKFWIGAHNVDVVTRVIQTTPVATDWNEARSSN